MMMEVQSNLQEQNDHLEAMDWEKTVYELLGIVVGQHTSKITS